MPKGGASLDTLPSDEEFFNMTPEEVDRFMNSRGKERNIQRRKLTIIAKVGESVVLRSDEQHRPARPFTGFDQLAKGQDYLITLTADFPVVGAPELEPYRFATQFTLTRSDPVSTEEDRMVSLTTDDARVYYAGEDAERVSWKTTQFRFDEEENGNVSLKFYGLLTVRGQKPVLTNPTIRPEYSMQFTTPGEINFAWSASKGIWQAWALLTDLSP